MPDREKVIKAVEDAFDLVHSDFIGTDDFNETEWEQNKADALSLLKEQQLDIEALKNTIQGMVEGQCIIAGSRIVRCKDCRNAVVYDDNEVVCDHIDSNGNDKHIADWYCADGERKEG